MQNINQHKTCTLADRQEQHYQRGKIQALFSQSLGSMTDRVMGEGVKLIGEHNPDILQQLTLTCDRSKRSPACNLWELGKFEQEG